MWEKEKRVSVLSEGLISFVLCMLLRFMFEKATDSHIDYLSIFHLKKRVHQMSSLFFFKFTRFSVKQSKRPKGECSSLKSKLILLSSFLFVEEDGLSCKALL